MQIRALTESDLPELDSFLLASQAEIQQFPIWEPVQAAAGALTCRRLAGFENGKIVAAAQIFERRWPAGKWWHVPRGPVFGSLSAASQGEFLAEIERLARDSAAVFVRFDWPELAEIPADLPLQPAHQTNFPGTTLLLDLAKSEAELLAEMKPKGRYNIRVAEKRGVTVRESTDPAEADIFADLLAKTTARDGFTGHGREYYRAFLAALAPAGRASLFVAELAGRPIAASIVTWAGPRATYYYGASDHEHRAAMAPYLVQWTAILAARSRGFQEYDFLGIAPAEAKNHPLAGVTDFKLKFGGRILNYPASSELVLNPAKYWPVVWLKRLRSFGK